MSDLRQVVEAEKAERFSRPFMPYLLPALHAATSMYNRPASCFRSLTASLLEQPCRIIMQHEKIWLQRNRGGGGGMKVLSDCAASNVHRSEKFRQKLYFLSWF